jgi:hypothetical protein
MFAYDQPKFRTKRATRDLSLYMTVQYVTSHTSFTSIVYHILYMHCYYAICTVSCFLGNRSFVRMKSSFKPRVAVQVGGTSVLEYKVL